jgi:hypothetical protein
MKAYRGSRGVTTLILNLGIKWRRVVNIMSRPVGLATEQEAGWIIIVLIVVFRCCEHFGVNTHTLVL